MYIDKLLGVFMILLLKMIDTKGNQGILIKLNFSPGKMQIVLTVHCLVSNEQNVMVLTYSTSEYLTNAEM